MIPHYCLNDLRTILVHVTLNNDMYQDGPSRIWPRSSSKIDSLISHPTCQGDSWRFLLRSDVVNLGRNSLLPRHASKPSAHVNHCPAAPTESTRQMHRLISACAGNSSKLSFQQFVKMYMKHKAKDIDGLDPGRENKHTILTGCCHLILFRGLSDKWMDWELLMISKVGTRVRISL